MPFGHADVPAKQADLSNNAHHAQPTNRQAPTWLVASIWAIAEIIVHLLECYLLTAVQAFELPSVGFVVLYVRWADATNVQGSHLICRDAGGHKGQTSPDPRHGVRLQLQARAEHPFMYSVCPSNF
jgi:hypothetical protein